MCLLDQTCGPLLPGWQRPTHRDVHVEAHGIRWPRSALSVLRLVEKRTPNNTVLIIPTTGVAHTHKLDVWVVFANDCGDSVVDLNVSVDVKHHTPRKVVQKTNHDFDCSCEQNKSRRRAIDTRLPQTRVCVTHNNSNIINSNRQNKTSAFPRTVVCWR